MRLLAFLIALIPGLALAAQSNIATTPRDSVSLISQTNTPTTGAITLGLKFDIAPGWHIYWQNPGDAGFAPQIALTSPASAGPLIFPAPELLVQPPVTDYVLSNHVILPFQAQNAGAKIEAAAAWLVCADICVPEHAHFTLNLAGGPATEAALFTPTQIIASPFPAAITPDGALSLTGPGATQITTARLFPDRPGELENDAPQRLAFTPTGLTLALPFAPGFAPTAATPLTGIIELTDKSGATQALALHLAPGAAATPTAPLVWLGLAFLGGLILNLMPCVFPILAMKFLAVARLGGAHHTAIRREVFGYTAGILAAMLAVAGTLLIIRAFGAAVGWGFQFQSPVFVALIAWLIFGAALNLAGIFEISGSSNFGNALTKNGSFYTGLLAVVVATPCTAPFMGAALAAALAAPPLTALAIFLALGLGLAAPFLILAFIPALVRALPAPGAWMTTLQRILGIPMFATFAWLAWVEHTEAGNTGLILLGIGAAALLIAVQRPYLRPFALIALLTLPVFEPAPTATALTLPGAAPFSTTRLAQLRAANQPVFIDFTAAWCVTCLVNERSSLATPQVQSALKSRHITLLIGDWTRRNPDITAYLTANHHPGVPLYLYYPPGRAPPITLPQLLTPSIVLDALN